MSFEPAFIQDQSLCFLGRNRLALDVLKGSVFSRPGDATIITGTLIEGYGNSLSDFDVYVVGSTRPSMQDIDMAEHHWVYRGEDNNSVTTERFGELYQLFDYMAGSELACDIEYWTLEDARKAVDAVRRGHTKVMSHGFRAGSLSGRQAEFLHKACLVGITLNKTPEFEKVLQTLSVAEYCYVLYRQYAGGYPVIRDIRGAWMAEEYDLAMYSARSHMIDQLLSLTFLELVTNPNPKWIYKKVQVLSDASRHIKDGFERLNNVDLSTAAQKREHILQTLDFMDLIYDRCRILLDGNDAFQSTAEGIRITEFDKQNRENRHPEFQRQLDYRMKIYRQGGPTCRELVTAS